MSSIRAEPLSSAFGSTTRTLSCSRWTMPLSRSEDFSAASKPSSSYNYLGTIDPKLWSGTNAGFTQVNISDNPVNNYLSDDSMLFLIGAVPKHEFIQGLYAAATTTPNAK